MSSRFTLDTNIITIRDVFAFNSKTDEVIPTHYFPVIKTDAKLEWLDPASFLESISIPVRSTTVLGLMKSIRPGFSTLSTNFSRGRDIVLRSTVTGLVKSDYVNFTQMNSKFVDLTLDYGYISSTSLYDCVKGLSKMDDITNYISPMILFVNAAGSNFLPSGYVSTINPGNYHIYYSTLNITGNNLTSATMNNTTTVESIGINLTGYENTLLNTSKLRIDITGNIDVTYTNPPQPQSILTTFSTFLFNGTRPIGTPVVVNYSNVLFNTGKLTYFLEKSDLTPFPASITLRHRITNPDNTNANITTSIPNVGGIQVRINNMD